jgi:integrase
MTLQKEINYQERMLDNNSIDQEQQAILSEFNRSNEAFQLTRRLQIKDNRLQEIGGYSIDISEIKANFCTSHFDSFTQVIASMVDSFSTTTIFSRIRALNLYFQKLGTNEISIEGLSRLHEMCLCHEINHVLFSDVRLILKHWHQLALPGVDDDIIDFVLSIKAPLPKQPAGSRVRSNNPEEGWYTDREYNSLVYSIWSSYESGVMSLQRTTLLLLSAQYGRRPIQMAHLKICDLKSIGKSCGVSGRRIEFPGAKDQGSSGFRESKIEVHPMGTDLWRLCQLQASDSINRIQECLDRNLTSKEKQLLPLFPAQNKTVVQRKIKEATMVTSHKADILSSVILHLTSPNVIGIIRKGPAGDHVVISERTGRPLNQYAYRNRYTRARQLARMGVPKKTLQYWMGHESPASLDAYYDDPAERARTLNDQIAPLLAPLSQAFQGTLRDKESDAVRGDDPTSRIELDGREESSVGTCGEHGFCTASVPIPCYRCTKFQPWVYGPHNEVLIRLLERQKLENEVPRTGQSRRLLVPVQLEKDIEAVKTVIALCENRKMVLEETE